MSLGDHRAVAPTPAGPVFFAHQRFAHAQITLFAKLDVGRAKPRPKQLSGAGKSRYAIRDYILHFEMHVLHFRNAMPNLYEMLVFYGGGVAAAMTWK